MSLCAECGEYPVGTRCAAMTCPGKFKVRPIALADGEGWPFRLLGRLPYRPVDFADWREGNLLFALLESTRGARRAASKAENAVSPQTVKQLLNYDPMTGDFAWAVDRRGGIAAGTPTGRAIDAQGYCRIGLLGHDFKAHRVAFAWMTGEWPSGPIDHIDRIKTNNAWSNLRQCSASENAHNKPSTRNISSGVQGVTKNKHGRWRARIKVNGREVWLGSFDDMVSAQAAYWNAKNKLVPNGDDVTAKS